jgi:hypothetical protein
MKKTNTDNLLKSFENLQITKSNINTTSGGASYGKTGDDNCTCNWVDMDCGYCYEYQDYITSG